MKFGVSEGMILAAGPGGSDIYLLEPDRGARGTAHSLRSFDGAQQKITLFVSVLYSYR